MLSSNLQDALKLTEINAKFIDEIQTFNDEPRIILFHFDGRKKTLGTYLYYLFETKNILILNPSNRTSYSSNFHGNLPYENVFNLESFPDSHGINFDLAKNELLSKSIRLIIPTSGTTASPKLVCFSEKKLNIAAKNIAHSLSINRNDIASGYLPTNYGYGLSVLHSHIFSNSKFLLPEPNEKFIDHLKNSRCTNYYTVPSMLKFINKFADKIFGTTNAKKICQAGGPLNNTDIEFWSETCNKYNIECIRMYGQTECGPRISCLRGDEYLENEHSVGKAIKGASIEISNINNEILIKSDMLADGYFNEKDNKWSIEELPYPFPTGDIGELNNNGYLLIRGRSSRFVKIQDIRLSLDEIEFFIQENIKVDVAAFQLNDYLAIVPSQEIHIEQVKFLNILSKQFGISKRNIKIFSAKFFTLNGNNKKDYPNMKAKVAN